MENFKVLSRPQGERKKSTGGEVIQIKKFLLTADC
jgi:hypothetical protein